MNEDVHATEEQQQAWKKRSNVKFQVLETVLIKDDVKNKALLNIGQIESEIKGKDGVT